MAEPDVGDVRERVLAAFDQSLRGAARVGGRKVWHHLIDILLFIDGNKGQDNKFFESLIYGNKFPPTGIKGAFDLMFAGHSDDMVASVYAEFANQHGWLRTDRLLSRDEYETLLAEGAEWCRVDRIRPDVMAKFGEPSCYLGSDSPYYSSTLMYVSSVPELSAVCFHLWNEFDDRRPSTAVYKQPVLRGMRHINGPFFDGFTFTPFGAARREQAPRF